MSSIKLISYKKDQLNVLKGFAPVLIPTLCRYEHFKRCLESLAQNRHAEKTDVFIALDYPLNESHRGGYNKICNFLTVEFDKSLFKSLNIIKRKQNYGCRKNILDARTEIFRSYDRLIFSEDDNEFSPNFLDYINKGLEKYKNHPKVITICGYSQDFDSPKNFSSNFFLSHRFDAWGYASWRDKNIIRTVTPDAIIHFAQDKKKSSYLKKKCIPKTFFYYTVLWCIIRNKEIKYDQAIFLSNIINNTYSLFPSISKSRNYGFDGLGMSTCNYKKKYLRNLQLRHENKAIDPNNSFDFVGNEVTDINFKYKDLNNIEITFKRLVQFVVIQAYFFFNNIKSKVFQFFK